MTFFVEVALPLPIDQLFSYAVPEELAGLAQPGLRVLVPFREKKVTGFILKISQEAPPPGIRVKPILSLLDEEPLFSPSFLNFIKRLSQVSFTPVGELLKAALPPEFLVQEKGQYRLNKRPDDIELKQHFRQRRKEAEKIIQLLSSGKPRRLLFLQRMVKEPGVKNLLTKMEKLGWVAQERALLLPRRRKKIPLSEEPAQLSLSFCAEGEFEPGLSQVYSCLKKKEFSSFLLLGPRSRREEFFLSLLKRWGPEARQILILLPEVVTSLLFWPRALSVLGSRRVVLMHGDLTPKKREAIWRRVYLGEADVVVGPRSAVFAPLARCQLVYIDEEPDDSYVHESPYYDAREAAWVRAHLDQAVLIYGASAPSVSLYAKAKKDGCLISLLDCPKPTLRMIAYSSGSRSLLSPELRQALEERIQKKEKAVILLNRRGYASIFSCSRCGLIALCPRCRRPLTLYLGQKKLVCGYCHYTERFAKKCRSCGSTVIEAKSRGVEAVEEEIKNLWPQASTQALDAETAGGKVRLAGMLRDFQRGRLNVLVGTQFLLPWLNWRDVSLVAVLHPEIALAQADFRSGERVFQLISRIRDEMGIEPGAELLIQTAAKDNYVLRAAGQDGYEAFATAELRFRRLLGLPPWRVLVYLKLKGKNLRIMAHQARKLTARLRLSDLIEEVMGPSVATRKAGKSQVQILFKARKKEEIISFLSGLMKELKLLPLIEIFS